VKYIIPVIDGIAHYELSTVDFEDDFDEKRPTPEEMEQIKWLAEREERMSDHPTTEHNQ
jgi:hypothetical protein